MVTSTNLENTFTIKLRYRGHLRTPAEVHTPLQLLKYIISLHPKTSLPTTSLPANFVTALLMV